MRSTKNRNANVSASSESSYYSQDSSEASDVEVREIAIRCTMYVLAVCGNKKTINRYEMMKFLHPNHKKNVKPILTLMTEMLKNIYRLKVVQVEPPLKTFIVTDLLPHCEYFKQEDELRQEQRAVLFLILGCIFMSGGSLRETVMWGFLRRAKYIEENTFISERLGNLETLIKNEWVPQHYLTYQEEKRIVIASQPNETEKRYLLKWGLRSEHEIDKDKILKFMREIYGRDDVIPMSTLVDGEKH